MASEAVPRLMPHDLAAEDPVQQTAPRMPTQETASFNPYLAARREWDERYGSLITRARNWRVAAFLALGIAVIETGGMVALAMRSKVVPFVVAVDNLGRVVASGTADQVSATDDRLKRAALVQWVGDWRTVTSDGVAQRKSIDRVYSMIGRGTPAQVQVSEYYRNDPPYKRAQTQMVSVDVKAVRRPGDVPVGGLLLSRGAVSDAFAVVTPFAAPERPRILDWSEAVSRALRGGRPLAPAPLDGGAPGLPPLPWLLLRRLP